MTVIMTSFLRLIVTMPTYFPSHANPIELQLPRPLPQKPEEVIERVSTTDKVHYRGWFFAMKQRFRIEAQGCQIGQQTGHLRLFSKSQWGESLSKAIAFIVPLEKGARCTVSSLPKLVFASKSGRTWACSQRRHRPVVHRRWEEVMRWIEEEEGRRGRLLWMLH